VDRSRLTLSPLDELRQIRTDIRLCNSLDEVRRNFDRLQEIRRQHLDDFELQIIIADAQQEIIERARLLRKGTEPAPATPVNPEKPPVEDVADPDFDAAEIPPDVPKLHKKSWQLAVGLAILFTAGIFAAFFYLIQTARRLNFPDEHTPASTAPPPAAAPLKPASESTAVSVKPSLRLYTDLTGGTVTIDDQPAKDLADGELNLDSLSPGTHDVRVESRGGSAAFSFALDNDKDVPRVTQISKSNNALVVLVSVKDGAGRLSTDAAGARISLDGKPSGDVGTDGLLLSDLGKQDHDIEISQPADRQKFVLTYTPAPTLTVFVKSDPSIGVVTLSTGLDGVSVLINDVLYKRVTDHGGLRIPLKVGTYRIRARKAGFDDSAETVVEVKKNTEASVLFHLQPHSETAILQIKGAQPGTIALIDHQMAATVGADGTARVVNITPGDHLIELHHDLELPKQLTRPFIAGQTVVLSGADTVLDRLAADNKTVIPAAPSAAVIPPPQVAPLQPAAIAAAAGEQVHKGGGFIAYHTPKAAGHYYFQAHTKLGGVLKHGKLQWYAGYQDSANYVLFSLDGKHAEVREVRDGKQFDVGKTAFTLASDEWAQIELSVKADTLQARVKSGSTDWTDLAPVTAPAGDFTKQTVGIFVPSNEEVAVANFRFSNH
jgi:hypothetical protein